MTEVRALIVDDSGVMRKIIERSLRQAGLDPLVVLEAGTGVEGLEILRTERVDLVLSDINMPAMDGLEFVRQIKAQNLAPGVPVVMITTESSEEHVKEAIHAGARGYIRKPFTAEHVVELLEAAHKAGFDVIKTEGLYTFNGERGYSLDRKSVG